MAEPPELSRILGQTLVKESDRGCVILGASLLSEALEDLLKSFCRQSPEAQSTVARLFRGYAPLATFSARTEVAYALGLLPSHLRDKINIVRRLRNDFAHQPGPIDFNDVGCADRLGLLISPPYSEARAAEEERARQYLSAVPAGPKLVARLAFILCVVRIITVMEMLSVHAKNGDDIRSMVAAMEVRPLFPAVERTEEPPTALPESPPC